LRGASALADVLRANPNSRLRVFVIWEPVLSTDWGTPSEALTANIPDRRVVQFFDHDRRLSAMLGGVPRIESLALDRKISFRMKDVIWDTALVYPPGVAWGSPAKLMVAPVVKFAAALSSFLPPPLPGDSPSRSSDPLFR
jgi:hypothetical protein